MEGLFICKNDNGITTVSNIVSKKMRLQTDLYRFPCSVKANGLRYHCIHQLAIFLGRFPTGHTFYNTHQLIVIKGAGRLFYLYIVDAAINRNLELEHGYWGYRCFGRGSQL
jgi:hypothetical protein